MKIFITGDTHGGENRDFTKLNSKFFPEGQKLNKNDIVIICGDFGLTWPNWPSQQRQQTHWLKWLYEKPWTTLFVDGNHEDHDYLQKLKTVDMFGGTMGKINDKLFHLRRGEIFDFAGSSFFCMGGAKTTDMIGRIEGVHWFRGEIPSSKEMYYAMDNLEKNNNKVDYIVAHTLPSDVIKKIPNNQDRHVDPTSHFLQEVTNRVTFRQFFCGHFHRDTTINNYTILYDNIIELNSQ